jgi:hypothetical protein
MIPWTIPQFASTNLYALTTNAADIQIMPSMQGGTHLFPSMMSISIISYPFLNPLVNALLVAFSIAIHFTSINPLYDKYARAATNKPAISVSEDSKLRQSLRSFAIRESKFLESIGTAHMEQEIQKRVLEFTKRTQDMMAEETGIQSSMAEDDMKNNI